MHSFVLLTRNLSEETYNHAATRVHKLLAAQLPSASSNDGNDTPILSKPVVEAAIKKVADRVNWGLENAVAVCWFSSRL